MPNLNLYIMTFWHPLAGVCGLRIVSCQPAHYGAIVERGLSAKMGDKPL